MREGEDCIGRQRRRGFVAQGRAARPWVRMGMGTTAKRSRRGECKWNPKKTRDKHQARLT